MPALHWIITSGALNQVSHVDTGISRGAFDNTSTFVVAQSAAGIPQGWNSIAVAGYKSYAQLDADLTQGRFPAGVRGVLYDNEAWAFTPTNEQQDPGMYIRLAAQLCHQHGLLLIATPAVDLTSVVRPGGGDRYQAYLSLGIAASAASAGADVFEIQAQHLETDAAKYAAFVAAAAAQARQAGGSHLLVLAGLSTGPSGLTVDEGQLASAVTATQRLVNGYWLNVPSPGPDCPACTGPRPDLAVALLRMLVTG